jgi:hypothetical protein
VIVLQFAATSDLLQFLDIVIWPLVIVGLIYFLTTEPGRQFTQAILASTRRIKAFGVELELGGEEDARRIKLGLEERFASYRNEVIAEFDLQAKRFDVGRLLAQVADNEVKAAVKGAKGYRCTVYVEDIVFKRVLYRLLDYYPGGDGKGSTYSSRFGIIGRSWRFGKSEKPTKVPDDPDELINTWGMTREEAVSQKDTKWYATYLLREHDEMPAVGLLYIESSEEIADDLLTRLDSANRVRFLTKAVGQTMEKIRDRGPYLEFFSG